MALHVTTAERRVLRACVQPSSIDDRFREWLTQGVVDDVLPFGAMRLLPFLLHVAPDSISAESGRQTVASIQRHTHARNLITLSTLRTAQEVLQGCGIETLVLKGGALVQWVYPSLGTRPASDGDLLIVSSHKLDDTEVALRSVGLRPGARSVTATQWIGSPSAEIDVHEFVKPFFRVVRLRDDFARDNQLLEGRIATLRVPSAEAMLFHVILHGGLYSWEDSHARWLLDAVQLHRAHANLDWERVRALGVEHRWLSPIHEGVHVLFQYLEEPVPLPFQGAPREVLSWASQRVRRRVTSRLSGAGGGPGGTGAGLGSAGFVPGSTGRFWPSFRLRQAAVLRILRGAWAGRVEGYLWSREFEEWAGRPRDGFWSGYMRYLRETLRVDGWGELVVRFFVPRRLLRRWRED